ncbi:MAG: phage minor capsid protein [Clostridia bacterium]
MLTPDFLENCSKNIVEKYSELERRIIRDVARRIAGADFQMTESAKWQIKVAQEAGLLYDDIISQVAIYTNNTKSEIKKLFEDSAIESIKVDDDIYKKVGLNPIPLKQNKVLLNVLLNGLNKTNGIMYNLTQTTAQTTSDTFISILDNAYMQISSGAFDYNTTIIKVINELADNGVKIINYKNGRQDKLEVAVRRTLITGVNQTSAKMQESRADEMDSDLVETTAHAGARPSHASWQGKVFSRSGKNKKYPNFVESTGYGTAGGLCGINCNHNFYPFFEGISKRAYTDDEIDKYNEKNITYNGKQYTKYEATQIQRSLERNIRADKRQIVANQGAILGTKEDDLKEVLKVEMSKSSVILKQDEIKLKQFIEQTKLSRDSSREQIAGWNRISSRKAINVNRNYDNIKKEFIGIKIKDVEIKDVSLHFAVERMIERGITIEKAKDALINPLKCGKIRVDGTQQVIGEFATVVINTKTGNVVSTWATGTKKAERLKKLKGENKK